MLVTMTLSTRVMLAMPLIQVMREEALQALMYVAHQESAAFKISARPWSVVQEVLKYKEDGLRAQLSTRVLGFGVHAVLCSR